MEKGIGSGRKGRRESSSWACGEDDRAVVEEEGAEDVPGWKLEAGEAVLRGMEERRERKRER